MLLTHLFRYGTNVHIDNSQEWTDGNALERDMERGYTALSEDGQQVTRGSADIRDDPVVAAATRDTERYGSNPLAYYGNLNEYDDGSSGRIYVVKGSDPEQKAINQRKIAAHKNPQVAS